MSRSQSGCVGDCQSSLVKPARLTAKRQTVNQSANLRRQGAPGGAREASLRTRNLIAALLLMVWVGSAFVAAAAPLSVAVLPVVVHSSDGDTDYLSAGLSDMLSARLEQAGGIEIIELESAARATTKAQVAVEAARSVGAGFVVFGSFTQFGDGASLDLRAAQVDSVDSDGEPETHKVFVQSGTLGAIIPRLDDVAGRIVHFLRGNGGAPAASESGEAPPPSTSMADLESRVVALEKAMAEQQAGDAGAGDGSGAE
jgi:TolB-like protein